MKTLVGYGAVAAALAVASLVSMAAAMAMGPVDLSLADVVRAVLDPATAGTNAVIVLDIRLSRVCLSFFCGGSLACAGVIFQGVLRNPLADPFTLGVSGGAAFGAALAISFGLALPLLPFSALAGSAAALILVMALGTAAGHLRRDTLVLAGVVISSFLAACISLVKALDEESVPGIVFWIMGSFQNRGWSDFALMLPGVAVGALTALVLGRRLDILSLGDREASGLGLAPGHTRLALLAGASAMTAACVAVSGIIGFVGLIVPHLFRLLLGPRHLPLLIFSSLGGGLLLLWADVAARTLLPDGRELPVGVVTALLGGPFFCWLLRRSARTGGSE